MSMGNTIDTKNVLEEVFATVKVVTASASQDMKARPANDLLVQTPVLDTVNVSTFRTCHTKAYHMTGSITTTELAPSLPISYHKRLIPSLTRDGMLPRQEAVSVTQNGVKLIAPSICAHMVLT
jgi:TRAP-type mannitol/chloroaromatic compound transport system substrate-binding protein